MPYQLLLLEQNSKSGGQNALRGLPFTKRPHQQVDTKWFFMMYVTGPKNLHDLTCARKSATTDKPGKSYRPPFQNAEASPARSAFYEHRLLIIDKMRALYTAGTNSVLCAVFLSRLSWKVLAALWFSASSFVLPRYRAALSPLPKSLRLFVVVVVVGGGGGRGGCGEAYK
jgi:hypothetical protein